MDKNINRPNRIIDINGVQWKLSRVIEATATDLHHVISRKERNKFDVGNKLNLKRVSRRDHEAYNRFYKDKQNPRENLRYNLEQWWNQVLSDKVRNTLYDLLTLPDEEFYKIELVKHGKHKDKRTKR